MFRNLSLLIFLLLFLHILFAQPKITKKTHQSWNSSTSQWDFTRVESWKFDEQGKEVFRMTERYSPGREGRDNYYFFQREYDQQGKLELYHTEVGTDSTASIDQTRYFYNGLQQLSEAKESSMSVWPDSTSDLIPYKKWLYYYFGNKKTSVKAFSILLNPNKEVLDSYTDTLFDDNGCIIQIYRRTPSFLDPTQFYIDKYDFTRDSECRILSEISSAKSIRDSSFDLLEKEIYEYSQGGKQFKKTYQEYSIAYGKWVTNWITVHLYDHESRVIEYQRLYEFSGVPILQGRTTYEYNGTGRLITQKEYNSNQLISATWFYFTFDHSGNMIQQKSKTRTFGTGMIRIITEHYTYYCDGQLKSKIIDDLPSVSRVFYEYESGGDCSPQNQEPEITVSPNPNTGHFDLTSPMLMSPHVTVRIFSPLGREVFTENLTQFTDRKIFDLHLPPGTYYLSLQDGKQSASKRILILE